MRAFFLLTVIFFGLNYSWTHAALARIATDSDCPKNLTYDAKRAVADLFGDARSSPIFMCLNEPVFGVNVSHGNTRFAPLLPAIVILGTQGRNLDVASHEYAHAELAARTSALLRTYQVPTWFDEGVAMQLDHRTDYSEVTLREYLAKIDNDSLTLNSIKYPGLFYREGQRGKIHYAFSRCVVNRWLGGNGQKELLHVLEKISWVNTFPSAIFAEYANQCLSYT